MKKRRRLITLIIISLTILALAIITFMPKSDKPEEVKIINKIDEYGYTLEDNKTSLHKDYFDSLVEVLKAKPIDEEAYAKLVVELFVSDFYNLDNKITKNDIGGIQYVYTPVKDNMILKAKDTIYKYVENNTDKTRKQDLPIVSNVIIENINKTEFEYGDEADDKAYEIDVKWTYKQDLGYQNEATIMLIHEDNKLNIAELK